MTADVGTLQNKAIFSRSASGSGRSQRHSKTSGWTPRLDNSRTDCWVGLVLSSPAAAIHGTRVVWTLTVWSRPRSFLSCLIDSMNGRLSMSPTVPPISQITKSTSSTSVSANSLIALVTCGITWTVAPR